MSRPCACGSGLPNVGVYDARNIFCCYACDRCRAAKVEEFRPEIFTDAGYAADEPIEDD